MTHVSVLAIIKHLSTNSLAELTNATFSYSTLHKLAFHINHLSSDSFAGRSANTAVRPSISALRAATAEVAFYAADT